MPSFGSSAQDFDTLTSLYKKIYHFLLLRRFAIHRGQEVHGQSRGQLVMDSCGADHQSMLWLLLVILANPFKPSMETGERHAGVQVYQPNRGG